MKPTIIAAERGASPRWLRRLRRCSPRHQSQRLLAVPAAALLVGSAIWSAIGSPPLAHARASATTATFAAAPAGSTTAKTVAAAKAFINLLSASQRSALEYSVNSSRRTGWSNLPLPASQRNGIALESLTAKQQAAALKILKAALGSTGYQQMQQLRTADDYLNSLGGNVMGGYGRGKYYLAFFGTPSTSSKWMLQFNGHHLAINLTFKGTIITASPYFKGVEPTSFTVGGKTYAPLQEERNAMVALFKSLSSQELASAKLAASFDDVLLGPGQDGKFPARQGTLVSSLSKSQQALVTKAIRAWVGDFDPTTVARLMKLYTSEYSKTRIAYSGSFNLTSQGDYVRIDGPHVWIEFVVQNGIVTRGVHYHSIYRDHIADYGA